MANEDEQDNSIDVPEAQLVFRYTDLTFTDPAKQETYTHFQRQATINKTTYTKFANESLKEITTTTKLPKNDALCKMFETQKEYFIKESKAKLEKATKNHKDFVTFVSEHSFTLDQMQGFEAYINAQSTAALKEHMNFMKEVFKLTENLTPEQGTSSQSSNNTTKYANRRFIH